MFGAEIGWVRHGNENYMVDYINNGINRVYGHGANIKYIRHRVEALI